MSNAPKQIALVRSQGLKQDFWFEAFDVEKPGVVVFVRDDIAAKMAEALSGFARMTDGNGQLTYPEAHDAFKAYEALMEGASK